MRSRYLARRRLLARRAVLLRHFHDALEEEDGELDARELEDGMLAAELWPTGVVARLGDELQQLHDVIAALARLDNGNYGTCSSCDGAIEDAVLDESPTAVTCADCAVTEKIPVAGNVNRSHEHHGVRG
jgi:RNA polymerase-binding transcription factor DksA